MFGTDALGQRHRDRRRSSGASNEETLFILEAPNGDKPDGTVLVEVTVESWNGALGLHMLNTHSEATTDAERRTFCRRALNVDEASSRADSFMSDGRAVHSAFI